MSKNQSNGKQIFCIVLVVVAAMFLFNFLSTWHRVTEERRIIDEERAGAAQRSGAIEVEKEEVPRYMQEFN